MGWSLVSSEREAQDYIDRLLEQALSVREEL